MAKVQKNFRLSESNLHQLALIKKYFQDNFDLQVSDADVIGVCLKLFVDEKGLDAQDS